MLTLIRHQISGWGNVNAAGGSSVTGPGPHGEETTTESEERQPVLTYSRGAVSKETVAIESAAANSNKTTKKPAHSCQNLLTDADLSPWR